MHGTSTFLRQVKVKEQKKEQKCCELLTSVCLVTSVHWQDEGIPVRQPGRDRERGSQAVENGAHQKHLPDFGLHGEGRQMGT